MAESEGQIVISKRLDNLMRMAASWLIRKIEDEDVFSAVMLSEHPDGRKASIYRLDSAEEAFARSEKDLATHLSDAEAYALVFDAWLRDEKRTPVIICRVEEQGMQSQYQFALLYELETVQEGKKVNPTSDFQFAGTTKHRILKSD